MRSPEIAEKIEHKPPLSIWNMAGGRIRDYKWTIAFQFRICGRAARQARFEISLEGAPGSGSYPGSQRLLALAWNVTGRQRSANSSHLSSPEPTAFSL
jgi:hypothetical protein